jgi:hypothetical protein
MVAETKAPPAAGYADRPVTKVPHWGGLVALDLLFNNLATGLFLAAALGELAAPAVFAPVARVAYPVALAFLLTDLTLLVLDLGDLLRFHHMLRVFKPSSPMSLGTWCLTAFSLPLTAVVALGLFSGGDPVWEGVRLTAVALGLPPALGSALYKGVLLSTTAQPGWRDARWLGGYLTSAALLLGCAGLLALAVVMGQTRAVAVLRPALGVMIVVNGVVLGLLVAELRHALVRAFTRARLWRRGVLAFGWAVLAPLALVLVGDQPAVLITAVLFLLGGSLAIRVVIVEIPGALTGH